MSSLADGRAFVDEWLRRALPPRDSQPVRLHGAMHAAVLPGGDRARPLLCRFVAAQCGGGSGELVGRLCAALELVHCASVVPVENGEAMAILVGDALLALGFETLARAPLDAAATPLRLCALLGAAVGSTRGVIGGHGAALFATAAAGGAIAAAASDGEVRRWARIGELVGRASQLRDDRDDVAGDRERAELLHEAHGLVDGATRDALRLWIGEAFATARCEARNSEPDDGGMCRRSRAAPF